MTIFRVKTLHMVDSWSVGSPPYFELWGLNLSHGLPVWSLHIHAVFVSVSFHIQNHARIKFIEESKLPFICE